MKRYGGLWDRITAWSNLVHAARKAQRGKCERHEVQSFNFTQEYELLRLWRELEDGTYRPRGVPHALDHATEAQTDLRRPLPRPGGASRRHERTGADSGPALPPRQLRVPPWPGHPRGGSWNNQPTNGRSGNRNRNTPHNRNNNIGFRVVLHFDRQRCWTPGTVRFTDWAGVVDPKSWPVPESLNVGGRTFVVTPGGAGSCRANVPPGVLQFRLFYASHYRRMTRCLCELW